MPIAIKCFDHVYTFCLSQSLEVSVGKPDDSRRWTQTDSVANFTPLLILVGNIVLTALVMHVAYNYKSALVAVGQTVTGIGIVIMFCSALFFLLRRERFFVTALAFVAWCVAALSVLSITGSRSREDPTFRMFFIIFFCTQAFFIVVVVVEFAVTKLFCLSPAESSPAHSEDHTLTVAALCAKIHRVPVVRADKAPNALEVPWVEVSWGNYFMSVVLAPLSPLLVLLVFLVEQMRWSCGASAEIANGWRMAIAVNDEAEQLEELGSAPVGFERGMSIFVSTVAVSALRPFAHVKGTPLAPTVMMLRLLYVDCLPEPLPIIPSRTAHAKSTRDYPGGSAPHNIDGPRRTSMSNPGKTAISSASISNGPGNVVPAFEGDARPMPVVPMTLRFDSMQRPSHIRVSDESVPGRRLSAPLPGINRFDISSAAMSRPVDNTPQRYVSSRTSVLSRDPRLNDYASQSQSAQDNASYHGNQLSPFYVPAVSQSVAPSSAYESTHTAAVPVSYQSLDFVGSQQAQRQTRVSAPTIGDLHAAATGASEPRRSSLNFAKPSGGGISQPPTYTTYTEASRNRVSRREVRAILREQQNSGLPPPYPNQSPQSTLSALHDSRLTRREARAIEREGLPPQPGSDLRPASIASPIAHSAESATRGTGAILKSPRSVSQSAAITPRSVGRAGAALHSPSNSSKGPAVGIGSQSLVNTAVSPRGRIEMRTSMMTSPRGSSAGPFTSISGQTSRITNTSTPRPISARSPEYVDRKGAFEAVTALAQSAVSAWTPHGGRRDASGGARIFSYAGNTAQ